MPNSNNRWVGHLVVNKLALRQVASESGDAEQRAKDLVGGAWAVIMMAHHVVDDLAELCGGVKSKPQPKKISAADLEDEDL